MAFIDKRLSEITAKITADDTDLLHIRSVSADFKITAANLFRDDLNLKADIALITAEARANISEGDIVGVYNAESGGEDALRAGAFEADSSEAIFDADGIGSIAWLDETYFIVYWRYNPTGHLFVRLGEFDGDIILGTFTTEQVSDNQGVLSNIPVIGRMVAMENDYFLFVWGVHVSTSPDIVETYSRVGRWTGALTWTWVTAETILLTGLTEPDRIDASYMGGDKVIISVSGSYTLAPMSVLIATWTGTVLQFSSAIYIGPQGISNTIVVAGDSENQRFCACWVDAAGTPKWYARVGNDIAGINWLTDEKGLSSADPFQRVINVETLGSNVYSSIIGLPPEKGISVIIYDGTTDLKLNTAEPETINRGGLVYENVPEQTSRSFSRIGPNFFIHIFNGPSSQVITFFIFDDENRNMDQFGVAFNGNGTTTNAVNMTKNAKNNTIILGIGGYLFAIKMVLPDGIALSDANKGEDLDIGISGVFNAPNIKKHLQYFFDQGYYDTTPQPANLTSNKTAYPIGYAVDNNRIDLRLYRCYPL